MKKALLLLMLVVMFLPSQAQFKGLHPDVWLRADQFDYKNKTWKDISGHNRHATKVQGNYVFTDSLINGQPAVYFNGNNTALRITHEPQSAEHLTVITVFQSSDKGDQGVWRATMGSDYDAFLTTQRLMNLQSLRRYATETALFPVVNTTTQTNDQPVKTLKGYIVIGGKDTIPESHIYRGKIAECMVFYRLLTGREQRTVQSYLALKYGATLLFSDYVDGKGNTLWSYEQNKEYAWSVAGIGRDDSTSFYQKQSASIEQDGIVSMAATRFFGKNALNTSVIDNNNYLLWSDNGQELAAGMDSVTSFKFLNRKWLVTASGNSISTLPVSLRVKAKEFFTQDDSLLYLAINRTRDAGFGNAVYIPVDSITSKGFACFSNLRWDTDKSGDDLFTFAVLPKKGYAAGMSKMSVPEGGLPEAASGTVAVNQPNAPLLDNLYNYKIWPNPTSGDFHLQLSYPEATEVTVDIFTESGVLVKQFKGRDSNEYHFTDHLDHTGYYLVRIRTRYGVETMKLIVVK